MTSGCKRVVGLALAAWLVGLIPVSAQNPKAKPPAAASDQKARPAAARPKAAAPAQAAPEEETFSYRAEGRRDPFLTLVRRGSESRTGGKRPEGVAGLAVAEITLKGVLATKSAFFAMVQGPDLRTYVVHPGDRLLDGMIKTIAADSIVIVQDVNDPLSLTKQREVRKTLRVAEEVK
jgi:Tfp pilus assembly protein PilP